MTLLLSDFATINDILMLHRHRGLDMRMGLVVDQLKVLILEGKDVLYGWIDFHGRKRIRLALELLLRLLEMIEVQMGIAKGMHKVSRLQSADLGHHHCQEGVARNIKRHAQENIGR